MCNRHKNLQKRISTRTRSLTTYLDALSMQNRPLQNLLDEMAPRAMTMPTKNSIFGRAGIEGEYRDFGAGLEASDSEVQCAGKMLDGEKVCDTPVPADAARRSTARRYWTWCDGRYPNRLR